MTAQVFIVLAQASGALLVPAAAIGNAAEGAEIKVRVLTPNGGVEERPIKIGIRSEIAAQVTSGLKEKDQIIIGVISAKNGNTRSALSARKGP